MSTSTIEQQKTRRRWDEGTAIVAYLAELARRQGRPVEIKSDLASTVEALRRRIADPHNQTRTADIVELRRVEADATRDIEAAQLELEQWQAQRYEVEREARQEWIQTHAPAVRREHAQEVVRLADALRTALDANAAIAAIQQQGAGAADLPDVGPIRNLPALVAPWLRVAREAGLVD